MKALHTAVIAILAAGLVTEAQAASGDTIIGLNYRSRVVRIRPNPGTGGGNVSLRIVLHANGSVEDYYEVVGVTKGKSSAKLGKAEKKFVYRVEDASTITRTNEEGNFLVKMTIKLVDKEKCSLQVDYILKPGEKEFQTYSVAFKQMGYYSSIVMESSDCRITN